MFGLNLRPSLRTYSDLEFVKFEKGKEVCHTIYKNNRLVSYRTREDIGFGFYNSNLTTCANDSFDDHAAMSFSTSNSKFIEFLEGLHGSFILCRYKDRKTGKYLEDFFAVILTKLDIGQTGGYDLYVQLWWLDNLRICELVHEIETAKENKSKR